MSDEKQKNIVITGATDGIGKATALGLARQGAHLLLLGRDPEKCQRVVNEIVEKTGNPHVESRVADLSRVQSMRRIADEIRGCFDHLDVLIHAAGGNFPNKRQVTVDGIELTFAVQYLARFYLTEALSDLLLKSPDPRVVSLAGGGTWSKGLDMEDLQSEKRYGLLAVIGKASATNDLLTLEQTARHQGIRFYNCGPGMVRTKTLVTNPITKVVFQTIGRLFTRSPDQAGSDVSKLATGDYPGGFYGVGLKQNTPTWAKANAPLGTQLWDLSKNHVAGI